jgi:CRISPR type III-associated protein (TIGR04423 family)
MNKSIKISAIPKDEKYTGYLWMSDQTHPQEYHSQGISNDFAITEQSNPFIIEGQLFCKDTNKSFSIKYVDGEQIVIEYDLNNVPTNWVCDKEKEYIPNRISASKIVFRQYWKPEKDEFCEGMEVLVPAAYVFVGFIENKEEK